MSEVVFLGSIFPGGYRHSAASQDRDTTSPMTGLVTAGFLLLSWHFGLMKEEVEPFHWLPPGRTWAKTLQAAADQITFQRLTALGQDWPSVQRTLRVQQWLETPSFLCHLSAVPGLKTQPSKRPMPPWPSSVSDRRQHCSRCLPLNRKEEQSPSTHLSTHVLSPGSTPSQQHSYAIMEGGLEWHRETHVWATAPLHDPGHVTSPPTVFFICE